MERQGNTFLPMEVFWVKDETPVSSGRHPRRVKATAMSKTVIDTAKCTTHHKLGKDKLTDPKKVKAEKADKASLKDLCPADKQRVANLIKELARLGDEKDTVKNQLQTERQIFECRIQNLIDQQDTISTERQTTAKQLAECQLLLHQHQKCLEDTLNGDQASDQYNGRVKPLNIPNKQQSDAQQHKNHSHQVTAKSINAESTTGQHMYQFYIDNDTQSVCMSKDNSSDAEQYSKEKGLVPDLKSCHQSLSGKFQSPVHWDTEVVHSDRLFTRKIDQMIADEAEATALPSLLITEQRYSRPVGHGNNGNLAPSYEPNQFLPSPFSSHHDDSDTLSDKRSEHPEHLTDLSCSSQMDIHNPSSTTGNKEYIKYYNKLGPEQRRQELLAQKSALLQEQKQLKEILIQQEEMLRYKQNQLHKQQGIQQQRLKYFEENGTFPPHHVYNVSQNTQIVRTPPSSTDQYEAYENHDAMHILSEPKHIPNNKVHDAHAQSGDSPAVTQKKYALNDSLPTKPRKMLESDVCLRTTSPFEHVAVGHTDEQPSGQVNKNGGTETRSAGTSPICLRRTQPVQMENQHLEQFFPLLPKQYISYGDESSLLDLVNEVETGSDTPDDVSLWQELTAEHHTPSTRTFTVKQGCHVDNNADEHHEIQVLEDVFFINQ